MDPTTRHRIERLVVRCQEPAAATPAVRLRAERHLAGVDWQLPGLPPAAVLVLRRVSGPALSAERPWPSPDWRERVQRQMADLARRAAQPAQAAVSPAAPAILFSDEAELLACLTADVLAGRATGRWYWRAVWPALPARPAEALAHAWSSRPAALPAGLGMLSVWDAARAVALLDRRGVSQVVRALHGCFALPDAALRVQAEENPAPPEQPPAARAPWHRWFPEAAVAGLSPQAHYLLGLAAALRCAPTQARTPAFAAAAAEWLQSALAAERLWPGPPGALTAISPSGVPPPMPGASRATGRIPSQGPTAVVGSSYGVQEATDALGQTPAAFRDAAADRRPGRLASVGEHAGQALAEAARETTRGSLAAVHRPQATDDASPAADALLETPPPEAADPPALPDWPGRWTFTGLGGVLYLINLLLRLDLPDGWNDPALAEHVGGWALLEALAQALAQGCQPFEGRQPSLAEDPLWAALAALDGRPVGAAIGADLPQPVAFRLPATWLRRYGPAEPRWLAAAVADRLVVWDAADGQGGYVVADVPLGDRGLAEAAAAEAARYAAAGVAARWEVVAEPPALSPLDPGVAVLLGPGLAWLLQRLLGFLRCWLARALLCPPAELDVRLAELLAVEGRVLVSRTHVDLFLSMDRIDLGARRAGLDRNPGWAPNLGRIVSFHFV
ncbi:MAG: hypothetical protein NZ528_07815 [Caldilineales bacterium]|nr:hypothetical protein [Caldilineales bacterium]